MRKTLLLIAIAAFISLNAGAQFGYYFKDTTTPYVPLTSATSLNGSLIWDEENLSAPMPFFWTINGGTSSNTFNLALAMSAVVADTNDMSNVNGFFLNDADIADRGTLTGTASLSPIRYTTTGTAPNRIFKAEIANGGFWDEFDSFNSMDDSFYVQAWIYETSNIVELHYGPSRVTHPTFYFGFDTLGGPLVGNARDVDFVGASTGNIYYLTGNPAAPGIDTFSFPPLLAPTGLTAWPANGKVYRFTPKINCAAPSPSFTSASPVGKTVQYTYTGTTTTVDSLVWDFGDGTKQKVTAGFTTPITHTFTTNGHYTVCVKAYNSCGNNNFCSALALSVRNLSALENVKVFPSPADNYFTVEGMENGGTITILSLVGKQILTNTINSNKQVVDISSLPAGTYMLLLANKNGATATQKITKQ